MSISPMYVGQTGPPWLPTVTVDGGAVVNFTGVNIASFVLTITDVVKGNGKIGGGVFTYVNQSAGSLSYAWGTPDTATAGRYTLQVSYTDTNGKNVPCDPIPWEVRAVGSLVNP